MLAEIVKIVHVQKTGNMVKSERERQELITALNKSLKAVEDMVSWAEAKGYTDEQEYSDFKNAIYKLMQINKEYTFMDYKHMD